MTIYIITYLKLEIGLVKKILLLSLLFSSSVFAQNVDVGQVCKASAATMFGRDHKIMQLDTIENGIAYVHYIRSVDNSRWAIKCKLNGEKVIWASNNADSSGRWRDDPLDSIVKYSVNGGDITISEIYSDGSKTEKTYPIKEL
nr:hypothetical protein [Proteus terrae]